MRRPEGMKHAPLMQFSDQLFSEVLLVILLLELVQVVPFLRVEEVHQVKELANIVVEWSL